jgi:ATP-dependent protease HslVU (ClpYQ) peptidase subunit
MTTIAYKDGVLACDGRLVDGNDMCASNTYNKLHSFTYNKQRICYGIAGSAADKDMLEKNIKSWLDGEIVFDHAPEIRALVVHNKKLYLYESGGFMPITDKHFAIGSGQTPASVAMRLGASAKEAIKIASDYDCFTGGKLRTMKTS